MNITQHITFTAMSLSNALATVRGLHDMSTELIASEVFRQISEMAATPEPINTIWCGHAGLYRSKLAAIENGEQLVAPAIYKTATSTLEKDSEALISDDWKESNE